MKKRLLDSTNTVHLTLVNDTIGINKIGRKMLLVALGCGRLPGIFDIAARNLFVVFGTMTKEVLVGLTENDAGVVIPASSVYFYEAG